MGNKAASQAGLCPSNLDFETGDFTNWECRWGYVDAPGNVNTVHLDNLGQVPGRHSIISRATAGIDPYGRFPEICPNGSGYSVRLGSSGGGHEAESISYTYTIPSTLTVFSMLFHYAVVLQDPNHNAWEQPRFRARITDLTTNAPIPCVDFDFTASASLPGFKVSPVGQGVLYKDWTPITINLTPFIGRTIQLEFITNDCIFQAHFGYAYIDVNTNCNGAISGTTICQGDNSVTLSAPNGFQSYEWFSDNTFSTSLGTTQNLPLTPAPAVGAVFPVIVSPYTGFGCRDTLYATISVAPKPLAVAGPDVAVCNLQPVQIGTASTPGYTYAWSPASQLNNASVANPVVLSSPALPTEFSVITTDILTGCISYDTTVISGVVIDDAIVVTGNADFCDGELPPALSVNNTVPGIQWYNNSSPITGATTAVYQPVIMGNYWAQLLQNGCMDSTSVITVAPHRIPLVSFYPDEDSLCFTNNTFNFHNTTTIADNASLQYNWKFSDGITLQTTDAVRSFTAAGMYKVEMTATSSFGCKDSTKMNVYVLPNNIPDFSWDSICADRPVSFRNLSNENGSPQVTYKWNFNNGGPGSILKNPLPVLFTAAGTTTVSLEMTSKGCEAQPQTITKPVQVNAAPAGIRYPDITVPEGSSKFIHVRDMSGNTYNWRPQVQLSNYNSRFTEFFATGNDTRYFIEIADKNTCITTDTLLMQILKKPGFYLPTAFTPNGDGLNDLAIPYLVGTKSLKSFSVFNRWGSLVFYSTKYGEGWNGKYKGINQDAGVYVWILEFTDSNNKKITERGTITIIR